MTLTKVEIAENLMEKFNLSKRQAKALVESFFEEIRTALESGIDVKLSGFGNFELRDKASRPGRNPKTGESVAVSARRVVVFKAGQKLRSRVEKQKG
ncbi:integration host factor subunit alpha [Volucribacter psittacicida]|uniref:Integration host factor subunit alpha n=1 Tax=Volucribacter psittacicida TaxID=203482 RepID=A0A4R1G201_9PAST|nr:integration host factor subunit alpha [Volucribacter psittacicida]TCK01588.1 integration host factor subunit alpha [Volucribacter psittacicida]